MITEDKITQVMTETGMDRIQAVRHLKAREHLKTLPNSFPLGKSAYDVPEQQAPKGD